jgi:hypothetical protein
MKILKNLGIAVLGAIGVILMITVDPYVAFGTTTWNLIVSIIQINFGIYFIVGSFFLMFYQTVLNDIDEANLDEYL